MIDDNGFDGTTRTAGTSQCFMFSEWQVAGLCLYSSCPHCWQSHAYNNTFDNLRADEKCLDDLGDLFATVTMPVYGLVQGHIVDFSLNEVVWTKGFCMPSTCCNGLSPTTGNLDNTNFRADLTGCSPTGKLIFDNNIYMQSGAFGSPYIYIPISLPCPSISIPIYYY